MEEVPQPEPVEESAKPKGDDPDDDDIDEEDLVSFVLLCFLVVVGAVHVRLLDGRVGEKMFKWTMKHITFLQF